MRAESFAQARAQCADQVCASSLLPRMRVSMDGSNRAAGKCPLAVPVAMTALNWEFLIAGMYRHYWTCDAAPCQSTRFGNRGGNFNTTAPRKMPPSTCRILPRMICITACLTVRHTRIWAAKRPWVPLILLIAGWYRWIRGQPRPADNPSRFRSK